MSQCQHASSPERGRLRAVRLLVGIAWLGAMVVTAGGTEGLPAQSVLIAQGAKQAMVGPSLDSMWNAVRTCDYTATQLRRFRDAHGQVTTVREQLVVDANGTADPAFLLTYQGVVGELPGSLVDQRWAATYHRLADQFHRSGSFHVRDLSKAQLNYSVHPFGTGMRANRSIARVVVFPSRLDKAIWVLDVDDETSVPLYAAEFDRQFRLLSELEVVQFSRGAQLPSPPPAAGMRVTSVHPDFASAAGQFADDVGLVEPAASDLGEYRLLRATVSEDVLNLRKTLVLTYTDGIDEFHVAEEPGTTDTFAGLPSQQSSGSPSPHTIARYGDHAMRVLMFWEDGVSFQVSGRGALLRLDDLARNLYRSAISN